MKKAVLLFSLIMTAALLGGCGDKEDEKTSGQEKPVAEEKTASSKENDESAKENADEKKDTSVEKEEPTAAVEENEPAKEKNSNMVQKRIEALTYQIPSSFKAVEVPAEQDVGVPYNLYQINEGASSFNIVAEDVSRAPGLTLEQYISASMAQAGYDYQNEKLLEVNGLKYHRAEADMANGLKMQQMTTLNDGIAYVVTYASPVDTYEEHLPVIEKIIQSFKFK